MTAAQAVAVTFRRATRADLPAIVALLADDRLGATREIVAETPAPAYIAAFDAIERDPNQLLVVGEADGAIAATLQLSFIPGLARGGALRGQIEAVRVRSDLRGAGVGDALFAWALEQCRARGCTLAQLTSDKARGDAHRFYERLGFVASHEGYKLALVPAAP